jgi:hypothetical protein
MPVLMGGEGVDDWDQSVCFISGRVDTAHTECGEVNIPVLSTCSARKDATSWPVFSLLRFIKRGTMRVFTQMVTRFYGI